MEQEPKAPWPHRYEDGILIIEPDGQISTDGFRHFHYLTDLTAAEPGPAFPRRGLVLDFSHAAFMPSAGIGMLIQIHKTCQRHGVPFVIHSVSDHIASILKVIGADRVLVVVRDRQAALAHIASAGNT